jgi:hypothetical protein
VNEVGLSELARRSDPLSIRALHIRLSLVVATLTLTALALGLASQFHARRWAAALMGIAGPTVYIACMWNLAEAGFGPVPSAWVPNLLLTVLAVVLLARTWRRRATTLLA